jgi:hypothetical protein
MGSGSDAGRVTHSRSYRTLVSHLPHYCCGCDRQTCRGASQRPCALRSPGGTDNETGGDIMNTMVGLRDAGHCTLAEILQFLGDQDCSSLDSEDNRGLALRNYIRTRPMVAKTEGALLVLGLLLAFGLIDRAVAQQQSPPGQGQVQVVPQTPGYQVPKPVQVTPQTSKPTPMYPQYDKPDTKKQK